MEQDNAHWGKTLRMHVLADAGMRAVSSTAANVDQRRRDRLRALMSRHFKSAKHPPVKSTLADLLVSGSDRPSTVAPTPAPEATGLARAIVSAIDATPRRQAIAVSGERLLCIKEVCHKVSMGKSTVYRWIKEGRFPRGIELAPQLVRWLESEIDAWIASFSSGAH